VRGDRHSVAVSYASPRGRVNAVGFNVKARDLYFKTTISAVQLVSQGAAPMPIMLIPLVPPGRLGNESPSPISLNSYRFLPVAEDLWG
jgi:hypothetical protein